MEKLITGFKAYAIKDGKVVNAKTGKELTEKKGTGKYYLKNDAGDMKLIALKDMVAVGKKEPKVAAEKPAKAAKAVKEKPAAAPKGESKAAIILGMWEKDYSVEKIIEKTGYPRGTVMERINSHNIRTLFHEGKTAKQIAAELDKPLAIIEAFIKRNYKK